MEKEKQAVVLSGMTAIVGTLDEKVRAFAQMASCASSGMFPAGYDTIQKIIAAGWFGDGLNVHPTVYMEGIQPVQFGGKTVREPKWEFVNALLRSRLPGFDFTVHEESDEACEIEFVATGRKPQRAKYTMAEAVSQGLAGPNGRNRDGYAKNARKMLWKQCFKMGADRIGSDVLAGLPAMSFEIEPSDDSGRQPSTAETINEAINKAINKATAIDVEEVEAGDDTPRSSSAGSEAQAPAPAVGSERPAAPAPFTEDSPRLRLNALLTRFYGKLSKDTMAEKVNLLYNAMMKEQSGVDPNVRFKKGDIGPVEAEQLIAYLEARMEKDKGAAAPAPADGDAPEAEREERPRTAQDAYDDLMTTIHRARKLFGRKFIQEAPPGSAKFWFTDLATFSQVGYEASVKLQVGPDVVAPMEKIEALNRILSEACDSKERAGR